MQVPGLLRELAGGGENGTACVLCACCRVWGCDLVLTRRSGGAKFGCRVGWLRGDVQARRLKAEPRGCSAGLSSSPGEVRPLPYLSQTHVFLLEPLILFLGRRSRGQNIVKTARAARRERRASGHAPLAATGTSLSGRSRRTSQRCALPLASVFKRRYEHAKSKETTDFCRICGACRNSTWEGRCWGKNEPADTIKR